MKYRLAPAMINSRLSKHYDLFVDAVFVGKLLQKRTLKHIHLNDDHSYLDVGCGTGTLAVLVKSNYPKARVVGIDPESNVITVAKRKAAKNFLDIRFIQAPAENLPFGDNTFDVITSSLAFHHMPTTVKKRALSDFRAAFPNY